MVNQSERKRLMEESLVLHAEWEERLRELMGGRQFEGLTQNEQEQFLRICKEYDKRIEVKLDLIYPDERK